VHFLKLFRVFIFTTGCLTFHLEAKFDTLFDVDRDKKSELGDKRFKGKNLEIKEFKGTSRLSLKESSLGSKASSMSKEASDQFSKPYKIKRLDGMKQIQTDRVYETKPFSSFADAQERYATKQKGDIRDKRYSASSKRSDFDQKKYQGPELTRIKRNLEKAEQVDEAVPRPEEPSLSVEEIREILNKNN
ncbi:MAG: hypothetical protein AAF558_09805, partial [Verrucomicrobiota bacterium]